VTSLRDPLVKNDPAKLAADIDIQVARSTAAGKPIRPWSRMFVIARATVCCGPGRRHLTFSSDSRNAHGVRVSSAGLWIVDSERLGPAVAGVRRFVYDGPSAARKSGDRSGVGAVSEGNRRSPAASRSGAHPLLDLVQGSTTAAYALQLRTHQILRLHRPGRLGLAEQPAQQRPRESRRKRSPPAATAIGSKATASAAPLPSGTAQASRRRNATAARRSMFK
jgi:hypothetical protein